MHEPFRILVISTDAAVTSTVQSTLGAEGHVIRQVSDAQQAIALQESEAPFHAVLFDVSRQPPSHVYELQTLVKQTGSGKLWVVAPLGATRWKADAERLGISKVLQKPVQPFDLLRIVNGADPASDLSSPTSEGAPTGRLPDGCYREELSRGRFFLAACASMRKIYDTIRLLAPVDVPVLILGESGVGKDIVANLLHKHSLRSQGSYISVNCAALPSDLLESELFGYEAGAFTGAMRSKPGKFEMANRGTLLLDEIGEMSAPMQAKLLHVLQDGQFSRLGARSSTEADVRVVAATNINIENAMERGSFRGDLFYRISTFTITVPPLRERREEIPFLVREMLCRNAASLRQAPIEASSELLTVMQEYDWPGNLRELSNFIIRLLILHDPEAVLADLQGKVRQRRGAQVAPEVMQHEPRPDGEHMRTIVRNFRDQTESKLIQDALDAVGWNRRRAAQNLKISYRGMLYKIQEYQLKENVSLAQPRAR